MQKIILLYFMATCLLTKAQDVYLSHHESAPLALNPALTGMYFGDNNDYRLGINYSSQTLGSLSSGFTTAAVSYDRKINRFGIGVFIINNYSGATQYNRLNAFLSGAYEISIDPTYRHNLVTGIQVGVFHHAINTQELTFGNQYNPGTGNFDINKESGESFDNTNITKIEAGIGSHYFFHDREIFLNPALGFSVKHLANLDVSFYQTRNLYYPVRYTLYSTWGMNLTPFFQLQPKTFFLVQGNEIFFDAGLFSSILRRESGNEYIFGILYNCHHEMAVHTGIKFNNNIFRISYGFNSPAGNFYSGIRNVFEFSVIFTRKTNTNPSFPIN